MNNRWLKDGVLSFSKSPWTVFFFCFFFIKGRLACFCLNLEKTTKINEDSRNPKESSVTLNKITWSFQLPHPQFTPDVSVFQLQSRCGADRIPF